MRNSLADLRWAAVLLLALAFPRLAQADPIVITGGTIFLPDFSTGLNTAGFRLTAEDSFFTGANFGGFRNPPPQGGPVNLSTGVALMSDFPVQHPVSHMVNGTLYQAFVTGTLNFTAQPFVIPPPSSDQSSFAFTTPFTMTGHITGTETNPIFPGAPVLFSVDVTGSGGAVVGGDIIADPGDRFYLSRFLNFRFDSSPAPTPEPSTLILLGSAVAGVLWRRARSA